MTELEYLERAGKRPGEACTGRPLLTLGSEERRGGCGGRAVYKGYLGWRKLREPGLPGDLAGAHPSVNVVPGRAAAAEAGELAVEELAPENRRGAVRRTPPEGGRPPPARPAAGRDRPAVLHRPDPRHRGQYPAHLRPGLRQCPRAAGAGGGGGLLPSLSAAVEHDYVQYVGQSQRLDGNHPHPGVCDFRPRSRSVVFYGWTEGVPLLHRLLRP